MSRGSVDGARHDQEIVTLLAEGRSRGQIATELGTSLATVKRRVRVMRVRMGARTIAELVARSDACPRSGGRPGHRWSERDLVIVRALAEGARVAEIAAQGGWTQATTRTYLSMLYMRVGARCSAQAVALARRDGVI